MEGVGNGHDASDEWNLLSFQPIWVTASIPALVVTAHQAQGGRIRVQRAHDLLAYESMLAAHLELLVCQRPLLQQDRVRDANLPEIMQWAIGLQNLNHASVQVHSVRQAPGFQAIFGGSPAGSHLWYSMAVVRNSSLDSTRLLPVRR